MLIILSSHGDSRTESEVEITKFPEKFDLLPEHNEKRSWEVSDSHPFEGF